MRLFTTSTALMGFLLAAVAASAQPASMLTGKMASFNYVFGKAWNCTANMPAMGGRPAGTQTTTATFDVVPNNVMHVHIAGAAIAADQYFGYSDRASVYWSTSSGSDGTAGAETSPDGKMYRGSMSMGAMTGTAQDSYTKVDDNHVTINSSGTLGGQSETTVINCSR